MVAMPRKAAAAIAVASALAALPCASQAAPTIIINPCLFSTLTVDPGPYNLSGNSSISYGCEVVGDTSIAVQFNQSGTSANTVTNLVLGNQAGSSGFYNLTGGTLNATNISGGAGFGVLNISGGKVNYTSMQQLGGLDLGDSGTGSLTAGAGQSISASQIYVGGSGSNLIIDSGANVSATALRMSANQGEFAIVSMTGGSLATNSAEIGRNGGALFSQTGGTYVVNSGLQLGQPNSPTGTGQYTLRGGTLSVGSITGSASSSLDISGGALNFASSISVGSLAVGNVFSGGLTVGSGQSVSAWEIAVGVNGGNGTLQIDSGSAVSTVNALKVGDGNGSRGTVIMNGGNVSSGFAIIGNAGALASFTQAGGTYTVNGSLTVGAAIGGANGTYNLSGGALTDNTAFIGTFSRGTFNQTGGGHTTLGNMVLGFQGGLATYTLRGGDYTVVGDITTGSGTGTLNIDGGTLHMMPGRSISVTNLALGSTPGTSGAYTQGSGNVSVAADMLLGGSGASGTYTLQGGSLSVGGVINTGTPSSVLNLDGGSLSVGGGSISVGTLNLGSDAAHSGSFALPAGGSVTARYLNVGLNGGGDFQQSGGSVTVGSLTIAANAGSSGSYSLSGGTLSAGTLTNSGLFSYTGGTLALTGAFANYGTFEQTGGTLSLPGGASHVNAGSMSFTSTSQLRVLDDFANHGTLTLNGAQASGTGLLHNDADGVIQGPGLIATPFANAGVVLVNAGTTRVQQSFANSGSIQLGGTGSTLLGGAISNTGSIQGAGTVGNNIQNSGTVEAIGGTLALGGAVTNGAAGLLTAGSGSKLVVNAGLASNQGTINLTGGTFDNNNHALANAGQISGYGIVRSGGLSNQGTITLATGVSTVNGGVTNQSAGHIEVAHGAAVFTGPVDNQGTFKTTGATVTFAGGFTNSGGYISDPSTQSFTDLVIAPTGYLAGGVGDVFKVSHSFINQSAQNTAWNTRGASLVFNGAGSESVLLAGLDKGALYNGYADNFAWGTLELGTGAGLSITSGTAGKGALYVGLLMLDGGLGQLASILSDSNIYYDPLLAGNGYLLGHTYALNGGGFLIPTAVPEPETYAMLLAGLGLLGFAARRRRALRG